MIQVYVKYNPYRLQTVIKINDKEVSEDSGLFKFSKGKRLQEWIGKFPEMLKKECSTQSLSLKFEGMKLDCDDFVDAFEQAKKKGIINNFNFTYTEVESNDNIKEKVVNIFQELQEGPIEDFRDPRLKKAFENVNNAVFPINVIATMSSGKSTMINSLLGKKLMPAKNQACTATITEILDTDKPSFSAVVFNEEDEEIEKVSELTLEEMERLNEDKDVHCILAEGDIPFLDSKSTALKLVDTPGPNNAQNQAHKNTTYRAINNDSNSLILYVLNGTQLGTNDDSELLRYISQQIKKGGKQVRDRFLFVVNKMDQFNPEEEDIANVIQAAKDYLEKYEIEEPQIFPCSAFLALNIRTTLKGIDIDNLTRADERKLPISARDTLAMIDKVIDYPSMHLEKYSTLSPSAQQEIDFRLAQAESDGDTKEMALIHSGICSIECAIIAYVKKYAKTKKIKDLVEAFEEVLASSEVLVKAKEKVACDQEAANACAQRAQAIRKKIEDGEEAKKYKKNIDALNPMVTITSKAEEKKRNIEMKTSRIFRMYGEKINNREEAKRLVNQFSSYSSDLMAEFTSELESIINKEIVEAGEYLLDEYQEKVNKFDENSKNEHLDFNTMDLIKGKLKAMRENADAWTSDDFATETVDDVGETTYEEKVYYEKVGQKKEEVIAGHHQEKIGTQKVKVGSHEECIGTRTVRNPEKRWWKFFTPKYIEEDVYEEVDDYEEQDVYTTVTDYKTIVKDIYKERKEKIEKFSVRTADIQAMLVSKMRETLDDGTEGALKFADEQIKKMKEQFKKIFDILDKLIKEKYEELERYALDQNEREARLKENREVLVWIEESKQKIDDILDMK